MFERKLSVMNKPKILAPLFILKIAIEFICKKKKNNKRLRNKRVTFGLRFSGNEN